MAWILSQLEIAYVSAYCRVIQTRQIMSPPTLNNKQALFSMENNLIDASKKRNMKQLLASELNDRLRSKADYIKYLD